MTARDTVHTFDAIRELLKASLTNNNGWSEEDRVKIAVELTQAAAASVAGR